MSRSIGTAVALLTIVILTNFSCLTGRDLNDSNPPMEQKDSLLKELRQKQSYIVSIRDSLSQLVTSRNDKITSAKFLVHEGRAELIKTAAKQILENYPKWHQQIAPLVEIVEGCEGHGVHWAVYCFGDMPYFGVVPILNALINKYELSIAEVRMIK